MICKDCGYEVDICTIDGKIWISCPVCGVYKKEG